jgi:hypothetical protein
VTEAEAAEAVKPGMAVRAGVVMMAGGVVVVLVVLPGRPTMRGVLSGPTE